MFNIEEFQKNNPLYEITKLDDFLKTEIMGEECKDIIIKFLELANFRSGEYEGNIYMINKIDTENVVLIDLTMEEVQGRSSSRSRCSLKAWELISLIKKYQV